MAVVLSIHTRAIEGENRPALNNGVLAGEPNQEGAAYAATYLRELGLTQEQIQYVIGSPPTVAYAATERDALALGIRPQVILSLSDWKASASKYCLAIP